GFCLTSLDGFTVIEGLTALQGLTPDFPELIIMADFVLKPEEETGRGVHLSEFLNVTGRKLTPDLKVGMVGEGIKIAETDAAAFLKALDALGMGGDVLPRSLVAQARVCRIGDAACQYGSVGSPLFTRGSHVRDKVGQT